MTDHIWHQLVITIVFFIVYLVVADIWQDLTSQILNPKPLKSYTLNPQPV